MSSRDGYFQGTLSSNNEEESRHLFTNVTPETPTHSDEGGSDVFFLSRMYCIIDAGKEYELKCCAYTRSYVKTALAWTLMVLTGGLLWLIFYWRPDWEIVFTHYPCTLNDKVDSVLLLTQDNTDRKFVEKVEKVDRSCMQYAPHLFEDRSGLSSNASSPMTKEKFAKEKNCYQNDMHVEQSGTILRFYHHYDQYIWSDNHKTFVKVDGMDKNVTVDHILDISRHGLSKKEQIDRQTLYKPNVIEVVIPSYMKLLLVEVLNPFYVFQLFACIFWMVDEYIVYASAILIMSTISAITSLIQVRRGLEKLHDMVKFHSQTKVTVMRRQTSNQANRPVLEEIWTEELVPGDVVVIPSSGTVLSYDAALISGTCIVNESMLTGESIPVTKTPLTSTSDFEMYDVEHQKLHTLYCGTEVIQTRYYRDELVKAVVVRTGFQTSKGKLVHSILFPKPSDLHLFRDAYRFVGILFGIAVVGFVYTVIMQSKAGESVRDIMFNAVDLITITVPPALPLALTIGIIYAQQRLDKAKIRCISPQRINIAGQVDLVAFDKTGTLTEDSLDLMELLTTGKKLKDKVKFIPSIHPESLTDGVSVAYDEDIIRCMATCHCLTIIDGKLTGDPLDVKMFEAIGWELVEPKVEDESKFDQLQTTFVRPPMTPSFINNSVTLSTEIIENQSASSAVHDSTLNYELGIVRQFPFTSSLQRSSVITRPLKAKNPNEMLIYVKGAPEKISSLCTPESIPDDFKQTLKSYTENGYRVIGLATKSMKLKWIKAQKINRDNIESDLTFIGLLVLQNRLKPNSCAVLETLQSASLRTIMVTGDNILTAVSVARDCNIIKPNLPVLVAHTTPPSEDYSVIGNSSGSPPTLLWEELHDTGTNMGSVPSVDKFTEKAKEVNLSIDAIPSCQLAVSGRDYTIIRQYFPEYKNALLVQGAVFARMSPKHKTQLMEDLQEIDYFVCMCGDGANDCGALKSAHVGLSLSDYEASVAAPFTAATELGVEAMTTLIREGRAALVTSFGMFKFMALYSLIQFTTITLLYNDLNNLADLMYLYIDLIVIDLVALTMSRNHAYKSLHWMKPPNSLMSADVLTSLLFNIAFQLLVQLMMVFVTKQQCWYEAYPQLAHLPNESNETTSTAAMSTTTTSPSNANCTGLNNFIPQPELADETSDSYVTTSLFYLSTYMYMSVSVAFSRGHPFRTRMYKNKLYMLSLISLIAFTLCLMFVVPVSWNNFMVLVEIPDTWFLIVICAVAIGHFIVCLIFEMGFIENFWLWQKIRLFFQTNTTVHKQHKTITKTLNGLLPAESTTGIPWENKDQVLRPLKTNGYNPELYKTRL